MITFLLAVMSMAVRAQCHSDYVHVHMSWQKGGMEYKNFDLRIRTAMNCMLIVYVEPGDEVVPTESKLVCYIEHTAETAEMIEPAAGAMGIEIQNKLDKDNASVLARTYRVKANYWNAIMMACLQMTICAG
jgi:hypothetical protein